MESVSELFKDSIVFAPRRAGRNTSIRNDLLKQLYALYTSQPEETKKENRRRYHNWVRVHYPEVCRKIGFSQKLYDSHKAEFRKAKLLPLERYIPTFSEKFFAIKMCFFKGEEGNDTLRYMISVARDKLHRNENVAAYILGSIKVKESPEFSSPHE
jgi:hypothetical protein